MKNVLLISLSILIVSLSGCIAYKSYSSEPSVEVFENLIGKQDDLYIKANEWMVSTFNDAESVIQFADKEEGTIIGKYLIGGSLVAASQYTSAADLRVYAIVDVRVKDSKARISVTPSEWKSYDESMYPRYAVTPAKIKAESELLINEFIKHMRGVDIDF